MRRSRKPVWAVSSIEGSNPSLSAELGHSAARAGESGHSRAGAEGLSGGSARANVGPSGWLAVPRRPTCPCGLMRGGSRAARFGGEGLMSDRASWLEEWCPTCRVAPGARCRNPYARKTRTPTHLHVARGWRARACPKCKALPGEPCRTPSGREASRTHQARLRPGRNELLFGESVWRELEARGATIATVPFSGRAGRGGRIDRLALSRLEGEELVDIGDDMCADHKWCDQVLGE